jgi:alcohol dehydrogenase YqhD (iron-dependent ADH family)
VEESKLQHIEVVKLPRQTAKDNDLDSLSQLMWGAEMAESYLVSASRPRDEACLVVGLLDVCLVLF